MISVFMLALILLQAPEPGLEQSSAYERILSEQNTARKIKLLLEFEKNNPKSHRLPEIYIQLSRIYASQSELTKAAQYADTAVAAAAKMKSGPPPALYPAEAWRKWASSIDASAKSNLVWVKQMVAWQQNAIHSSILRGR